MLASEEFEADLLDVLYIIVDKRPCETAGSKLKRKIVCIRKGSFEYISF